MNDSFWFELLDVVGPRLYRYFLGSFAPDIASELVQECFARFVEAAREGKFDPSKGAPGGFVFGIARLVRLECLRARYKQHHASSPESSLMDRAVAPEEAYLERERQHRLRQAIAKLPEPQRECVLLSIDQELSLADIAELVQLPINTVKSHLHRAKESLRASLAPTGGE